MRRTWSILILAAALAAPAGGALADSCKQDADALKAKISEHAKAPKEPQSGDTQQGKASTDQGWYGHGVTRAKELLFNAEHLAKNGKEESCKRLVFEAHRAMGLVH